jgi:hypothetical protein
MAAYDDGMKKRTHEAAAVAALVWIGSLGAAGVPDRLDGSFIEPYTNLWKLSVTLKDGRTLEAGTWSDEVVAVDAGGKRMLRRTQIARYPRRNLTTTTINVFEPQTLRPFGDSRSSSEGDVRERRFDGSAVTVIDATGECRGLPVQKRVTLTEPFYDFSGGMYGLVILGFPLAPGYRGTIPTPGETDETMQHVSFTVSAEEQVEAKPGTQVRAWVVDVAPDADGAKMRFWLTRSAPYIIKLVYDAPKAGQVFTYTMI